MNCLNCGSKNVEKHNFTLCDTELSVFTTDSIVDLLKRYGREYREVFYSCTYLQDNQYAYHFQLK